MPREVIETALAAFDARRPDVEVLGLFHDSRGDTVDGRTGGGDGAAPEHELRFGSARVTVVVRVRPVADSLHVEVDVPGHDDLSLALEQLAPSLRLVQYGPLPAVFEDVHRGFVSIVGLRPPEAEPVWCTAWTRL